MIQYVAIAACGLLLVQMLMQRKKKDSGLPYPPGPGIWEMLYHLLLLRQDVQKITATWADRFGELTRLRCGIFDAIIVNTWKAGKDILGSPAGSGRFKFEHFVTISGGPGLGIMNADGKHWAEARKQALAVLQRYGFGRKDSEAIIMMEANVFRDWIVEEMKKSPGGIPMLTLNETGKIFTSSSIWQMIASKRLTPESMEIYNMMHRYMDSLSLSSGRGLLFFPWLRYIFPKWTYYEDVVMYANDFHKYIAAEFDRHKETYEEGKLRDLMDSYVKHLNEVTDPNSCFYGERGQLNAVGSMVDLLIAVWDSVSASIVFTLCYLAAHPECQRKVHEEIDRVLGREQTPSSETKNNMPYMLATIDEAFRMGTFAPLGLPHQATEDIEYNGYKIKKGSMLICHAYRIHFDKAVWGDPENFRPERFLVEGGKELKKFVVPFSIGKRSCPGAPLSTETVYIFLSRILQNLEVHMDPNTPKEKYMETEMMIAQLPKNYKLIFKPRA